MAADDTYSASELRNRNLGATNDSLSATQLRAKHGIVGGTCTGKDLAGNSGGQASLARLAEKIEELEKKEKIQREATESVVHALAFMQEWLGRNSLWSNEVAVTEKGIEEAEEPEKLERAASVPSSLTPGSSSNGSSSSSAKPDMSQAFDAMSTNPEMIEQATEMMSKMSDEDIARMMPGTNPAMVKQSMQNKDQLKTAMESFKNMPEDQRKQLMEQAQSCTNCEDWVCSGCHKENVAMFGSCTSCKLPKPYASDSVVKRGHGKSQYEVEAPSRSADAVTTLMTRNLPSNFSQRKEYVDMDVEEFLAGRNRLRPDTEPGKRPSKRLVVGFLLVVGLLLVIFQQVWTTPQKNMPEDVPDMSKASEALIFTKSLLEEL